MSKFTNIEARYIMLDEEGNPVERYHQDDECDVVEARSIEQLLDCVAERVFDLGADSFVEMMKPGGEYEGYKVVRQEIHSYDLDEGELDAAIERLNSRDYGYDDDDDDDDDDTINDID